jgi:type IV secretory pathway VirB3-like protein
MTAAARLDYANIGLMLLSFGVAMFLPFELFLFSYAVLGPAHYLTEISWLHQRKYFTRGPRDYVALVLLAVVAALLFLSITTELFAPIRPATGIPYNTAVYLAFAGALVMVVVKSRTYRLVGLGLLLVCALVSRHYILFFSFFLPTIVHVYLFTGCFILYGALKTRSRTALTSLAVFVLCPLLFLLLRPAGAPASSYAVGAYQMFETVNQAMLHWFTPGNATDLSTQVYASPAGLVVMRFIAFAYTYHYLNWFSKTSIIQWHQMPKGRLAFIAALWLASVATYWVDYQLGLKWLFFLSLSHVFLEFPLNHLTILNIGRELKGRVLNYKC